MGLIDSEDLSLCVGATSQFTRKDEHNGVKEEMATRVRRRGVK